MNANINTNNNFSYTKQPFYILYKENNVINSTYQSGIILSDSHIAIYHNKLIRIYNKTDYKKIDL